MPQKVISFHYTLKNTKGEVLDSSIGQEPFPVLEGVRQIIPTLEDELLKMNVGEKKQVFVPADKAYGQVNEKLRVKVNRDQLPEGDIQVGTQFRAGQDPKDPVFTVTKMEEGEVFLDGNHPLAGEDLQFDVEVIDIREATQDELQHGHAHGAGGHHH